MRNALIEHSGTITDNDPARSLLAIVKELQPPRFEDRGQNTIAGLSARYERRRFAAIPDQWHRFVPYIGTIEGQIGHATYGVCYNADDEGNMDYLCGVEVAGKPILADLTQLEIPARRYVIFAHRGPLFGIKDTWNAIYREWFPTSGCKAAAAPEFEYYGEDFDPQTQSGTVEIWIPLAI